jgi:ubiquinone/menaquinone biosynthesis C-methylase UbiE
MTASIRQFFEDHAPTWDDQVPADIGVILRTFAAPMARMFSSARNILEIGTGTGTFVPVLREFAPDVRLVSIDVAYTMLQGAQRRCPDEAFVQADVHHLPAATGSFDLVICHNSFPHFADKSQALHEIGRVLHVRGQLMILHNNSREFVNRVHKQAGAPIHDDLLPSGKTMAGWLVDAGFHHVQVDDAPTHYIATAHV